jgi:hypothetical protein
MEFSNQTRSKKIKRIFSLIGILIVVIGLVFLWLKMDTAVLITAAVFSAYIGIAQFANLCFVAFSSSNGKFFIRYFPIISMLKKDYESVEFAQTALVNFHIEKSMGFADLTIVIKTKRGIAEYPSISLAALSKSEIEQIREELAKILKSNSRP